jgi:predicted DNA-binding transcriptional regulator AlpA
VVRRGVSAKLTGSLRGGDAKACPAGIFPKTYWEDSVQEPILLSLQQAAEFLGLTPSQLYEITRVRYRKRHAVPLPYIRLGRRLAFRRETLLRWIEQLEAEQ